MKKNLVVANWKMNPTTVQEASHLFNVVRQGLKGINNVDVVFCPPFPFLYLINVLKKEKNFALGAQDLFWEKEGAYTGEVSPLMLKDLNCQYVIIGHSERRRYFREDDKVVDRKVSAALKNRLRPIIAVGEQTRESFDSSGKDTNEVDSVVEQQVRNALVGINSARAREITFAYEPVWAIGTGKADTPEGALSSVLYIRKTVAKLYDRKTADDMRILYGGSVNSKNVSSFVRQAGIDGVLVGGASLNATEFINLVKQLA